MRLVSIDCTPKLGIPSGFNVSGMAKRAPAPVNSGSTPKNLGIQSVESNCQIAEAEAESERRVLAMMEGARRCRRYVKTLTRRGRRQEAATSMPEPAGFGVAPPARRARVRLGEPRRDDDVLRRQGVEGRKLRRRVGRGVEGTRLESRVTGAAALGDLVEIVDLSGG